VKTARKYLLGGLILLGLQFGPFGCVAEVGPDNGGVYYYDGGPWFHDDVWVGGGAWGWRNGGGGWGYVHPRRW
jgi:hypothetical protein